MKNIEEVKKLTSANLEAWNEVAPIHKKHNQADLLKAFSSDPEYSVLDNIELKRLNALEIEGKDFAQICCNNGRELLCVKKMNAARCVGFDGGQNFIDQARELAKAAKQDVEFVCTNIYDIDDTYKSKFDVVTITIGVICWMPDVVEFFKVASKLLKPDGALFIYEQHPLLDMIEPGDENAPITWEISYFDKSPYVEPDGLDYFGGEKYDAKPATSFTHTMSDIIMAGINSGMTVEHFEEFPGHISNTWYNVESANIGFPMSYTLVLRKT